MIKSQGTAPWLLTNKGDPRLTDREPIFNIPVIITVIIGILVVIHAVRAILAPEQDAWILLALSFIPARYTETYIDLPGGDIAALTSPITYMLLHGDLMHLTVNALWLLVFGSAVATRTGAAKFLTFSILCGLGGIAAHLLFHWGELAPVLGASAAISGQMAGAMRFFFGAQQGGNILDIRENPKAVPRISIIDALKEPKFLLFFAFWIILNIAFGLGAFADDATQGIAWEAHIGGFITGLLIFQWFDGENPVNPEVAFHPSDTNRT